MFLHKTEFERRKVDSLNDRRHEAPQRGAYTSLSCSRLSSAPTEIPIFDGNPLSYWKFICSLETHIARRMPTDAARLVTSQKMSLKGGLACKR